MKPALLAAAILPALAGVAAACPNCTEQGNQGLEWGIYLMIGGVLTIGGAVVFMISRIVRAYDAADGQ